MDQHAVGNMISSHMVVRFSSLLGTPEVDIKARNKKKVVCGREKQSQSAELENSHYVERGLIFIVILAYIYAEQFLYIRREAVPLTIGLRPSIVSLSSIKNLCTDQKNRLTVYQQHHK